MSRLNKYTISNLKEIREVYASIASDYMVKERGANEDYDRKRYRDSKVDFLDKVSVIDEVLEYIENVKQERNDFIKKLEHIIGEEFMKIK